MESEASPLLRVKEAAGLVFPDLPTEQAARKLYRWTDEAIIPPDVLIRAGRALYFRRGPLLDWLGVNGNAAREQDGLRGTNGEAKT
jgi:hypothetical protein